MSSRSLLASLFLFGAASVLAIGPAGAGTIDLSWDQCVSGAATPIVQRSATDPGTYTIALTGRNLAGRVVGTRFVFALRSPDGLPPAWRFDAAGCTAGSLEFATSTTSKACPSIGGLASTTTRYELDPSGRAATLSIDVLYGSPGELLPTATYSLGRVLLDLSAATPTGTGSGCEGFDEPVCIELAEASIIQEGGSAEVFERGQAYLTWNDPENATICSATTLHGIQIQEFTVACGGDDRESNFLELSAPAAGTTLPAELRIRTESAGGAILVDDPAITPETIGQPWPGGGSWLLGTERFEAASGLPPDRIFTPLLDPYEGRIVLYDARPGGPVLQELAYGGANPFPAPPPGNSLVRSMGGDYVVSSYPDPRNYVGASSAGIVCPPPPPPPPPPPLATGRFAIREVAMACFSGSPSGQFVEVESLDDSVLVGNLILEVLDSNALVIAQQSELFFSSDNTVFAPGRRSWLVATSSFQSSAGVAPDQLWNGIAASNARTFRLRAPNYGILFQTSMGGESQTPLPVPGTSMTLGADGSFTDSLPPTPRNWAGATATSECFPADTTWAGRLSGVRIAEVATSCEFADTRVSFFELRAEAEDQELNRSARVEVFDSAGNLLLSASNFFAPRVDGETWPAGRSWLFGSADVAAAYGIAPDAIGPRLDPSGGRIRFYDERLPARTIDELRYGADGSIAAPPAGSSIRRLPDGSWTTVSPPQPENFSGAAGSGPSCPCPLASFRWGSLVRSTDAASFDSTSGARRLAFDRRQPSITIDLRSTRGTVTLGDRFVVTGAPAGQEIEIMALFHVRGASGGPCFPVHGCAGGSGYATWSMEDTSGALGSWANVDQQFAIPLRVRIGEEFPFFWTLGTETFSNGSAVGEANFNATFEWANLPPGLHVESCAGYFDDTPVAALPSIVSATAEDGVIRLEWSALTEEVTALAVERRTSDAVWSVIGMPDASRDRIAFEDRAVVAGEQYAYRLSWSDATGETHQTDETWVEVPGAVVAFTAKIRDGVVRGAPFDLALSLPNREEVQLALYDLRGRRLADRAWVPERTGSHEVRFAPERSLPAGVYWIRVQQGAERATLRAIVLADGR